MTDYENIPVVPDNSKQANKRPRPIDHLVLSLPDLDRARQRFEALGFSVHPDARHHFGTENAIIGFANGSFIEPLAIGDDELVQKYLGKRHPFVVRDNAFRFRHGKTGIGEFEGGFSMLAFGGLNAKKARKKFKKFGLRTGKLARVKRPGLDLRTAFALDERAGDCTLFVCERKDGPPKFDVDLTNHANGATRLVRVVMVDENPGEFSSYLETVCRPDRIEETEHGLDMAVANGWVSIYTPDGLQSIYGIEIAPSTMRQGPRLVTYDIGVSSMDKTAMLLAGSAINARQVGERIVVANAPGQGAALAFVEDKT